MVAWTRSRRTSSTSTCRATSTASAEDRQDIEGHLQGGIPVADIDALQRYWASAPSCGRRCSSQPLAPATLDLAVDKAAIKSTIYEHPEFAAFIAGMNAHFAAWRSNKRRDSEGAATRVPSPSRSSPGWPRTCWPITPASR
jgi:hypothetical protein